MNGNTQAPPPRQRGEVPDDGVRGANMRPLTKAMTAVLRAVAERERIPTWASKRTLAALVKRGLLEHGGRWCMLTVEGRRVVGSEVIR